VSGGFVVRRFLIFAVRDLNKGAFFLSWNDKGEEVREVKKL
jgi:hypothetical protein